MTFKDLAKRIATCYNSLPALVDALRDGFNEVEGGGSSDIEYSTEEKKIGKWIDGSDLYEKTLTFNNITIENNTSINHNITGLKMVIDANCMMFDTSNNTSLNFSSNGDVNVSGLVMGMRVTPTALDFRGTQSFTASTTKTWYITLRYTK